VFYANVFRDQKDIPDVYNNQSILRNGLGKVHRYTIDRTRIQDEGDGVFLNVK
jgi:hypothetical protein